MLFTNLGKIVAYLLLGLGLVRLGIAAHIMFQPAESQALLTARYLGADTLGGEIDETVMTIGWAIILGVLVEISKNLKRGQSSV